MEKVGVYDSRVLAYAHFWNPETTRARNELVRSARQARKDGNDAEYQNLHDRIEQLDRRNHLQVFSTESVAELLAAIAPRLESLQRELGVVRLVSRWDEAALAAVPETARVDVTDRLAAEFLPAPTDRQREIMAQMKEKAPLPLPVARMMAAANKL
ncbi:hypothetical protein DB354_08810 [Opitutus sp. ER46]|nr:hypothetical protein DB354_08810 [Opitutus sp. ER46]